MMNTCDEQSSLKESKRLSAHSCEIIYACLKFWKLPLCFQLESRNLWTGKNTKCLPPTCFFFLQTQDVFLGKHLQQNTSCCWETETNKFQTHRTEVATRWRKSEDEDGTKMFFFCRGCTWKFWGCNRTVSENILTNWATCCYEHQHGDLLAYIWPKKTAPFNKEMS